MPIEMKVRVLDQSALLLPSLALCRYTLHSAIEQRRLASDEAPACAWEGRRLEVNPKCDLSRSVLCVFGGLRCTKFPEGLIRV
jgi:hypothetical protein